MNCRRERLAGMVVLPTRIIQVPDDLTRDRRDRDGDRRTPGIQQHRVAHRLFDRYRLLLGARRPRMDLHQRLR